MASDSHNRRGGGGGRPNKTYGYIRFKKLCICLELKLCQDNIETPSP